LAKIDEIINEAEAGTYLKPITYAYKTMSLEDFEALQKEQKDFDEEEDRVCLESDLIFAATFYLDDPLRPEV
jgi:magnesium-transporting ATPase (P-type)